MIPIFEERFVLVILSLASTILGRYSAASVTNNITCVIDNVASCAKPVTPEKVLRERILRNDLYVPL